MDVFANCKSLADQHKDTSVLMEMAVREVSTSPVKALVNSERFQNSSGCVCQAEENLCSLRSWAN